MLDNSSQPSSFLLKTDDKDDKSHVMIHVKGVICTNGLSTYFFGWVHILFHKSNHFLIESLSLQGWLEDGGHILHRHVQFTYMACSQIRKKK